MRVNVKRFRIFVLVLLAVLLPIRGAVAAAMLCPTGSGPSTAAVVAEPGHHGMQADHGMHAEHAAMHHHGGGEAAGDDSPSGAHATACQLCASGCCMASMVGTFLSLGQPTLTASLVFPALDARVPAFQSDGQERPPRTI